MSALGWKMHKFPRGARKGAEEKFLIEPRQRDGMYMLKQPGIRTNRDQDYTPEKSIAVVKSKLSQGWAVRMRGQVSRKWCTLNGVGVEYA